MKTHRKLAAALVGLASLIAARYGIDLDSPQTAVLLDVALAFLTAFGVYQLPNAPQKDLFK